MRPVGGAFSKVTDIRQRHVLTISVEPVDLHELSAKTPRKFGFVAGSPEASLTSEQKGCFHQCKSQFRVAKLSRFSLEVRFSL